MKNINDFQKHKDGVEINCELKSVYLKKMKIFRIKKKHFLKCGNKKKLLDTK